MKPEAIVVSNSDQVATNEFDRFVSTFYSSKLIFLGNLSEEQALRIRMYKHTLPQLSHGKDSNSRKFYEKFLLIAGQREYDAFLNRHAIGDERYRELVNTIFSQTKDPSGRAETGTRVHVRGLGMTFMYGFYGSGNDSNRYISNRIDENDLESAFERIVKRNKTGVICGHPLKPLAYARDEDGAITNLLEGSVASIPIETANHYLLAPGALNDGYFAVIGKDTMGRRAVHFNRFEFNHRL